MKTVHPRKLLALLSVVAGLFLFAGNASAEPDVKLGPVFSTEAEIKAKGILTAYNNDLDAINKVADNADYALLAWAAYEDPEAIQAAKSRGWTPIQSLFNDNFVVGVTSATLFVSDKGKHVVAFRGTENLSDWYTNLGTIVDAAVTLLDLISTNPFIKDRTITSLSNQQINGAREIAEEVAKKHSDVVFVGHSLGGRLAQVARIQTNKPAISFDSAPLSIDDKKEVYRRPESRNASYLAFRGPDDPLPGETEGLSRTGKKLKCRNPRPRPISSGCYGGPS